MKQHFFISANRKAPPYKYPILLLEHSYTIIIRTTYS